MLVKHELKPGYAELLIAAISSRTCTKPTVEPTPLVKMIHQIKPLPFVFTFKYLNYAKKMSAAK